MPIFNEQVLDGFRAELSSYVPKLQAQLAKLVASPADMACAAESHRLLHSIRGACNMIGLADLSELAQGGEELLDRVLEGGEPVDEECATMLVEVAGMIRENLAAASSAEPAQASAQRQPPRARPEPVPSGPRMEDLPAELVEGFLQEAEEHLQSIDRHLRELRDDPGKRPLLQEIRRSVHTLKGAAGMVGFHSIQQLAHRGEDLLDELYEGQTHFTPDLHSLVTSTYDTLCDLVAREKPESEIQPDIAALYASYDVALRPGSASSTSDEKRPAAAASIEEQIQALAGAAEPSQANETGQTAEPRDPSRFVRVPIERLDELVRLVTELLVNRSTFEQHHSCYVHEVGELSLTLQRLRRVSNRLETGYGIPAVAHAAAGDSTRGRNGEFDALEFDRYTEFHLLTRDLAETGSDIATASTQLTGLIGDFDGSLGRLGRLVTEVQDKLMRLRMVPLAQIASRLHRTVRVTAEKRGKQTDLVIEGGNVELDKAVLEEMSGPLEHLLRNSVDHGIEEPSRRAAAGKPVKGLIRLRASHEGSDVVIRLADDGGGLHPETIRAAAVRQGYVDEAVAESLSSRELHAFLFEPGFSTATEVTDTSGRGVGLDVVRDAVRRLKGSVSVDSDPGEGICFSIRLPMTLAIAKVLMVREATETLAIPLASVTQIARAEANQIEWTSHEPVLRLDGRILPIVWLGESLGIRKHRPAQDERMSVIAIRAGDDEFALVVDKIVEARQVVVKSLGGLLRRVPRMAGATLMGDGSVVLIVNPAELTQSSAAKPSAAVEPRRAPARRALDVLIVDDSLSVRRVVANLVSNAGWNALQAKDGVEALEVLRQMPRRPDIVLMDVEMPRMDGFELAATMRGQPAYRDIPIVMLTSRAGQKHRQKAMSVGVGEYLVKPYQDEELLGTIRRCVGGVRQPVEARAAV